MLEPCLGRVQPVVLERGAESPGSVPATAQGSQTQQPPGRVPRCQSGFWNLLIDRSSGAAFLGVVLRHERENQQQGPLVAPGEESRLPTLSVLLCRGSSSCFCSGHLRDGSLTLGHQLLRVSRRCLLGLRLLTLEPSTVLTDTSQPLPCLILLRLNMVV